MFAETANLGGLDIQLVWYRGLSEFHASTWVSTAAQLVQSMNGVYCAGGLTQIGRVLSHVIGETRRHRINALVFIGDCIEEDVDRLCHVAGDLGVLGVPIFLFHEGREPGAASAFRQLARLSHGAYCSFDSGSAKQLRELLAAVAVYAAGGKGALEDFGRRRGGLVQRLTHQLGKG
jgi:predicted alpha/beta-hydrolase family hydrolase